MKRLLKTAMLLAIVATSATITDSWSAIGRIVSDGVPNLLPTPSHDAGRHQATVVRVIDGDTIRVRSNGRELTVRAVAIDTPETSRPGRPLECGGPQATAHARRLLPAGTKVTLVDEPGGDRVDRYGRRLAWIHLRDGTTLQGRQLRAGWATIYRFGGRSPSRERALERAAAAARTHHRGVYRLCGGNFHAPAH